MRRWAGRLMGRSPSGRGGLLWPLPGAEAPGNHRAPSGRRHGFRWCGGVAAGAILFGALGAGLGGAAGSAPSRTVGEPPISFGRDVRPILSNNCFKCHGPDPEVRQAGLRLDTREGATTKLKSGRQAVIPGSADASLMMELVTSEDLGERMPPV